tara:strand:+ start:284 stop:874 length:591 start_codon:yes stop_codon:yes gene_type:complete
MTTPIKLKKLLKDLIPYIEGRWFVGDGALLGLIRGHDLIEHDNDIDIYLLPGSSINLPEDNNIKIQKYYMEHKVYDNRNEYKKLDTWQEYIRYKRCFTKGMSRAELYKRCSDTYNENKIKNKFTLPFIDVYYLKEEDNKLKLGRPWNFVKYDIDMEIIENNDLGYSVPIPKNAEAILKNQYGDNCLEVVNKQFYYF